MEEVSVSALNPQTATRSRRKSALIKGLAVFLVLVALSLTWRYTAIGEWVNFETILGWQASIKNHPAALLYVTAAYLIASLVLFPVTILSVASVLTFGPVLGNLYSMVGWLLSAALGFGLGRLFGGNLFCQAAGPRLNRYLHSDTHGFFTVLTIRLLPIAPFTGANFFMGTSTIRFRDFMLGSTAGRIPGMIIMGLAGVQLERLLRAPTPGDIVLAALILIVVPLVISRFSKSLITTYHQRRSSFKLPEPQTVPGSRG